MNKKILAVLAVLFLSGCGYVNWDGKVAGAVPVSVVETPLNALSASYGIKAGSLLLGADQAAVKAWGEVAKQPLPTFQFPIVSATTNHFDSKNQEVHPPFRTVITPVYAAITNAYAPVQALPTPVIIDSNTIQQIISAWVASQGKLGTVTLNPQPTPIVITQPVVNDGPDPDIGGAQPDDHGTSTNSRPKFGSF